MKYLKSLYEYKKLDLRSHYEKQVNGDYIECYYNDELFLTFEGNYGTFIISNYSNNFDEQEILELNDSYNLEGEISPIDLKNLINEIKHELPSLVFVGLDQFFKKYFNDYLS